MARQSSLLLTTTTNNNSAGTYVGTPVRADGWYGRVDHLYTLACYVSNLQGTLYLEASLADVPGDSDWFSIVDSITFPRPNATPGPGETAALPFSFRANVTWIRARVVQTGTGFVDRVLLNQ